MDVVRKKLRKGEGREGGGRGTTCHSVRSQI